MPRLPIKKLSFRVWLQIFGIWTLAAVNISTQIYLNVRQLNPEASWLLLFLKQLPAWYLYALLTPVIIYFYECYPLDIPNWKKNLLHHIVIALLILLVFSHFRLLALTHIQGTRLIDMSLDSYLHAFPSQLAWDLAVYAFIMAVIFADKALSSRKQKELEAAKMELRNNELESQLYLAQLEALKLQLNPHFLFNTLNTVSSLIRSGDSSTAIQVNARLGAFLRTTLYAPESLFVPFQKEIEYMDLYLGIESLRFRDRLKVVKEIYQECLSYPVPYFILQPILENAVKHGIARQRSAKVINIQAVADEQRLNICIYNEGKLLPSAWVAEENWHIGLSNVYKRLQKMYGNLFIFQIENHPDLMGVQVRIGIPKTPQQHA